MTYSHTSQSTCNAGFVGSSLADICHSSQFVVFLSILNELVRSNEKISGVCERVRPINTPDKEYDFVVIGGGGAGAVAAGRLSENPDWKILLVEAGPDEPVGGQIPGFFVNLIGSETDWSYMTTNESYACLGTNGSCLLSAGKMLGGSTAHNGMVYLRGNPTDYNNWAELGNEGWTWDEVKKFYLMSEDNGEIEKVGRFYHATGGPQSVETLPYVSSFGKSILEASVQAGYGVSKDLNGKQITGFTISQTTSKNGVRRSSSRAFLWPIRNRKNLHISLNSLATRVIIKNNKAIGVEYYQNGQLKTVHVSHEVVVSAGTIKSPHILMLSGIGPKNHLESVGIKVIKNVPGVGENFHDHVGFSNSFTIINEPEKYDDYAMAAEYLVKQTGPLSTTGLNQMLAILKTKEANSCHPDLQVYFTGFSAGCPPSQDGVLQSNGLQTVGIAVVNLRPRSRGRIYLASNDPFEYPVIWGNYLSDPRDVDGVVQAIELGLALTETEAMKAWNLTLSTKPIEACSNYTFPSTKYWACAVRYYGGSPESHLAGTCKMGPSSDPMAVVDPRLRVYGIKGLRVADNSIMPQVTSGNTAAPASMIGARVADFIKKDWDDDYCNKMTSANKCRSKCSRSKIHFVES